MEGVPWGSFIAPDRGQAPCCTWLSQRETAAAWGPVELGEGGATGAGGGLAIFNLVYCIASPTGCMCVHTHWVGEDTGPLSPRQQYLCNETAAPGLAEARPGLSHLEQKRQKSEAGTPRPARARGQSVSDRGCALPPCLCGVRLIPIREASAEQMHLWGQLQDCRLPQSLGSVWYRT